MLSMTDCHPTSCPEEEEEGEAAELATRVPRDNRRLRPVMVELQEAKLLLSSPQAAPVLCSSEELSRSRSAQNRGAKEQRMAPHKTRSLAPRSSCST
ncbi:unnamed protein product [Lota lota]